MTTLSYELCLKLKEAGFQQRYHWKSGGLDHFVVENEKDEYGCPVVVEIPTLSELIEECTPRVVLWQFEDRWCAGIYTYGSDIYIDDYPSPCESGDTPEEAVASLYLELNKK